MVIRSHLNGLAGDVLVHETAGCVVVDNRDLRTWAPIISSTLKDVRNRSDTTLPVQSADRERRCRCGRGAAVLRVSCAGGGSNSGES